MKGLLKSKAGMHAAEVDDASAPAKRQILIEVKAASFNRADYHAGPLMAKERVVSSDVAGIVRAVGEDVREFAVGDRACAVTSHLNGGFAGYAIADEKWAAHLPGNMDFVEGAAIPSAGVTALAAVEKAWCSDSADVLVCGASGGVGQYAVALAKAAGAHVIATCSASNLDAPRAADADAVSAAGFRPAIEEYEGFEGAERALSDLETRHPSGKIVVTLGD